jgi:DNA-binding MarR family transcriptional regulator
MTIRGPTRTDPQLIEQIERDLRGIRRALREPLDSEIARGGLTPPQMAIMQVVASHDGISLKELSRVVGLAHSTVSGVIDRLESKGLLERRVDHADGRISRIQAAAAVKRFVANRLPKLFRSPLERALRRASRTEQAQIGATIQRLRELLEETSVEAGGEQYAAAAQWASAGVGFSAGSRVTSVKTTCHRPSRLRHMSANRK